MSQIGYDVSGQCPGCGQGNEPGMLFCMFCGQSLRAVGRQTLSGPLPGRSCPSCGQIDNLNNRFCIYCGADTTPPPPPSLRQTQSRSRMVALDEEPPAPEKRGHRTAFSRLTVAAVVAGAVVGVLGGFFSSKWLEESVAKGNWPPRGLVLYTSPGSAEVAIEEVTGAQFTLGRTGPEGALSVPDLPPGNYRVTISAPGYKKVDRDVQIGPDKVVVLGYPDRIELTK